MTVRSRWEEFSEAFSRGLWFIKRGIDPHTCRKYQKYIIKYKISYLSSSYQQQLNITANRSTSEVLHFFLETVVLREHVGLFRIS